MHARYITPCALLVCLLGPGCRETPRSEAPTIAAAPGAAPIEVITVLVRRGTLPLRITAPGTLVARRTSKVGAEVTGLIEEVFVNVGDRFEKGDPLFRIDDSTYKASLRQAQAGLELARAERRQLDADLARASPLHKKKVLAEQELERVETQVAVAKARERQALAAVAVARQNLERTQVNAPYAGTVARRLADEGTTAQNRPQTIVLLLQETGELEGRASLPESHHARVRVGDRVLLHVDGIPEPIDVKVTAIADTIDEHTRTFLVRTRVPNPDHRYKAGTFTRVEIFPGALREALLVPREAIRSEAGRATVLLVRDGRAIEVPLQIGLVSEDTAEVLAGVKLADEVIVGEAAQELAPGTLVRPSTSLPPST
jgi:RND family efflux transporter MFP subunit